MRHTRFIALPSTHVCFLYLTVSRKRSPIICLFAKVTKMQHAHVSGWLGHMELKMEHGDDYHGFGCPMLVGRHTHMHYLQPCLGCEVNLAVV